MFFAAQKLLLVLNPNLCQASTRYCLQQKYNGCTTHFYPYYDYVAAFIKDKQVAELGSRVDQIQRASKRSSFALFTLDRKIKSSKKKNLDITLPFMNTSFVV